VGALLAVGGGDQAATVVGVAGLDRGALVELFDRGDGGIRQRLLMVVRRECYHNRGLIP